MPLFRERLQDKDAYIRRAAVEGLGRAGDRESPTRSNARRPPTTPPMVRLAAVFALQKLGRNYAARVVDLMGSREADRAGAGVSRRARPRDDATLVPRLQEPDANVREAVADVLGVIGDASIVPALEAAAKDRDPAVAARRRKRGALDASIRPAA